MSVTKYSFKCFKTFRWMGCLAPSLYRRVFYLVVILYYGGYWRWRWCSERNPRTVSHENRCPIKKKKVRVCVFQDEIRLADHSVFPVLVTKRALNYYAMKKRRENIFKIDGFQIAAHNTSHFLSSWNHVRESWQRTARSQDRWQETKETLTSNETTWPEVLHLVALWCESFCQRWKMTRV